MGSLEISLGSLLSCKYNQFLGDEATEADQRTFAFIEADNDWPESNFHGAAEAKEVRPSFFIVYA